MQAAIIDITRGISTTSPTWPGDEPFSWNWTCAPGAAVASVSAIHLSAHLGTHLDAPRHLDPAGTDVASVRLELCLGPCEVVGLPGLSRPITPEDLPSGWRPRTSKLLLATGSWPRGAPLPARFTSLSPALVEWLADAGVTLIGIDTPSVDDPDLPQLPAHKACLARSVLILEGLDLTGVTPGRYTLVALPLPLAGLEASPVRAVLLAEQG